MKINVRVHSMTEEKNSLSFPSREMDLDFEIETDSIDNARAIAEKKAAETIHAKRMWARIYPIGIYLYYVR